MTIQQQPNPTPSGDHIDTTIGDSARDVNVGKDINDVSISVGRDNKGVIAGRDVKNVTIADTIKNIFVGEQEDVTHHRNRQTMLQLVKSTWVKGVLEHSLYNEVLINLNMGTRIDAVEHPWDMVIRRDNQKDEPLAEGTKIVDVFDQMNQSLLILGEPGSGKTTMLLELGRDLIAQAEQDATLPIPVIFNLSSWAETRQPLADWLADEFNTKYRIPKKIAQQWIDNDELLLLLDGLDEVKQEHRVDCVDAINIYRQDHLVSLAICSRIAEYEALNTQLNLRGAVVLLALTKQQIDDYLTRAGGKLQAIQIMLEKDLALQQFVQSPLTLSIMTLAYQDKSVEELETLSPIDIQREHLFNAYIVRMFARTARTMNGEYSNEQVICWLKWLSAQMWRHRQTVFMREQLRPSWIQDSRYIHSFMLVTGLLGMLFIGLSTGLINGLVAGLSSGIEAGLSSGIIAGLKSGIVTGSRFGDEIWFNGLIGGLGIGLRAKPDGVKWTKYLNFDWLTVGLLGGLLVGLVDWGVGLLFGSVFGLIGTVKELSTNQSLWLSFRNISVFWLILCLATTPIFGMFSLLFAFSTVITLGLIFGLIAKGETTIKRAALRILLWHYNLAPLDYARFLDYCHSLIFLRKVGGGYIFIHRMLMEHFANMTDEDIKRIAREVEAGKA